MLNSFTTVNSLASTIKSLTEDSIGAIIPINKMERDDLEDINTAATTIKKKIGGNLWVSSKAGLYTTFSMIFKN